MLDYDLPAHLIAQHPSAERDQSRLLVARRQERTLNHRVFGDLPDLLSRGDLLVLNNTRVLAARLLGRRERTGGRWEGLFLRRSDDGSWEMLCQTRGRLFEGETIAVADGLRLRAVAKLAPGRWVLEPDPKEDFAALLTRFGSVPLPPYIRKGRAESEDAERYQTVFAREAGAVAAPTAGLHFTERVFDGLRRRGIDWTFVTLHVGPGTFQPIQVEDFRTHRMHSEWCELSADAVSAIEACKNRGGRVIAVGTTSVRVLESVAQRGPLKPWSGETELFIYPPFEFKAVDGLVTNFHLPRSTLLLLVGAFAGTALLQQAYAAAIEHAYRFYSYGDAMLIL